MRGKSYILWVSVIAITFVAVYGIVSIYIESGSDSIFVESFGAFVGILLAIAIGEILKLEEKHDRGNQLLKHLAQEVRENLSLCEAGEQQQIYEMLSTDIWDMAISSGELSYIGPWIRDCLTPIYKLARLHNQYHIAWINMDTLGERGKVKAERHWKSILIVLSAVESHSKSFLDIEKVKRLLEWE